MKILFAGIFALGSMTASAQVSFVPKFSTIKFEEIRKLTQIENKQKDLLACVTKFISKNKAETDGPNIIYDLLNPLMVNNALSESSKHLIAATEDCKQLEKDYPSVKRKYIDLSDMNDSLNKLPRNKLGTFISRQYRGDAICKAYDVSANAGFLLSVGAGVGNFKCLMPSGIVRNYLGLSFKIGYGTGVKVGYTETRGTEVGTLNEAGVAFINDNFELAVDQEVYVVGAMNKDFTVSMAAGLGFFSEESSANTGVRFFNGKRRWGYLIDQLK